MAATPSIGDLIAVSTLLKKFIENCVNAPIEFEMALINVHSIQYSVDMICIVAEDRKSKWYTDSRLRKGVVGQAGLCKRFISRIDEILRRYPGSKMSNRQRLSWMMGDKSKLNDTVGYLDKMVDRFSSYLDMLGYVSPGHVEPLFDESNDPKTVADAAIASSRYRNQISQQEKDSLIKYTRAVSKIQFTTPAPINAVATFDDEGRRELCLECWTIDTYTKPNQEESTIGTPERQSRCQQRLKQMIDEFEDPNYKLPLGAEHARVQYLLKHRESLSTNPNLAWVYIAGRILTYESLDPTGVATQTAMVIIRAVDTHGTRMVPKSILKNGEDWRRQRSKPVERPLGLIDGGNLLQVPSTNRHARRHSDPPKIFYPDRGGDGEPVTSRVQPPRMTTPIEPPTPPRRPSPGYGLSPTSSAVSSRASSPSGRKIKLGRRCKWASRCRTVGCKKEHPSECPDGKRCGSLSCNHTHQILRACGSGEKCRDVPCNYDHGKMQCSFDPCMDDNCGLKHRAGQKAVTGFWAIVGFEEGSDGG